MNLLENVNRPTDRHRSQQKFIPERCLVIGDLHKSSLDSINQDTIRKAIGQKFDPIMFYMINRHKYKFGNPKYIIQLSDPTKLNDIVANWKPHLLGGFSIHRTLKPRTHIGMLRRVATNIADE